MIFECDVCDVTIPENTYYYSLNLNYEKFEKGGIAVATSNCLLTLCDRCIDELPVGKILSYGVRMGGSSGDERYEMIKKAFSARRSGVESNRDDK